MTCTISILRRAQKDLAELPHDSYMRVRDAIRKLAQQPRPPDSRKLVGRAGWRLRVGSYRVVYEIDDSQQRIIVLHIGHRKDVYRA
ncbi:MAG TPA: type II toxin-antitoxin system RelE/ParE family toxin [Bacillota bacterium]|nr:type II toxin-antitoxin system RelE/ParE family toxin [Bacillota bacterium]